MTEHFVPYDIAFKLQTLGFDELCLASFNGSKLLKHNISSAMMNNDYLERDIYDSRIPAPLWQQAFDWLESTHGISCEVVKQAPYKQTTTTYWYYMINDKDGKDLSDWHGRFNKIMMKAHQDASVHGNSLDEAVFNKHLYEDFFAFKSRYDAMYYALLMGIYYLKPSPRVIEERMRDVIDEMYATLDPLVADQNNVAIGRALSKYLKEFSDVCDESIISPMKTLMIITKSSNHSPIVKDKRDKVVNEYILAKKRIYGIKTELV